MAREPKAPPSNPEKYRITTMEGRLTETPGSLILEGMVSHENGHAMSMHDVRIGGLCPFCHISKLLEGYNGLARIHVEKMDNGNG